jgi:hypothetical protein
MEVSQEFAQREREKRSAAHADYIKLVVRHERLTGVHREELYRLCGILGINADALGRDTDVVKEWHRQETFIANAGKIEKASESAARAVQDALAEKEKVIKELDMKIGKLHSAHDAAQRDYAGLSAANSAREQLRMNNPLIVAAMESEA